MSVRVCRLFEFFSLIKKWPVSDCYLDRHSFYILMVIARKYKQRRIYFLCNTVQVVVAYNYPSGVLPAGISQNRSE